MRRTGGLGSGASDPLLSQRGYFFIYFHYIFIVIFIFWSLVTFCLWSTSQSKGLFVSKCSLHLHRYLYILIFCNLLPMIYSSAKGAIFSYIFIISSSLSLPSDQGGIKCANRRTGFIDSEGSHRSIAKTPNIRCFVVKLHLLRFTRFFRGNIPILW